MNIPAQSAIKHFFPSTAFDLVYSEAVANALDAGATKIDIAIDLVSYSKPEKLKLEIRDNGVGFDDDNYLRFQNLMMAKDAQHKGLGRLVYLQYFSHVDVESVFSGGQRRTFTFKDKQGKDKVEGGVDNGELTYTILRFGKFTGVQIKSYDYVSPMAIKRQLKDLFMPKLLALKKKDENFKISITLKTQEEKPDKGFVNGTYELTAADIAEFSTQEFFAPSLHLIDSKCRILYRVDKDVSAAEHKLVTALCIDGRTIPFKIASEDQLPPGTSATFLLEASFLDAKTNESRQELVLKQEEQDNIRSVFIEKVAEILNANIPEMKDVNAQIKESLDKTYPHLAGYFNQKTVGLINRNRAIIDAQTAFCRDEKEILEAQDLSDELYEKSLSQASRVLTQYILYRDKIIRKMESITSANKEADIHQLIVPMKRTLKEKNFSQDLYSNNAWLLDDKYMTYRSILSDEELKKLIEQIMSEEEQKDVNLRPDIAFVFSDNIETVEHPVDVVLVELKRKGLDHLGKHAIIEQIRQRARRLVTLYPTKIQRMWFFGVIDFDKAMRNALKEDEWTPMYSKGESYYKELSVLRVDADENELPGGKVPVSVTLLSQDAIWKDAKARNEAFLSILRESIKESVSAY